MKWFKWILSPLSLIFWFITEIRNQLYDFGILKEKKFNIPIIGIGNITVGGTGKTPHTEYIAKILKDKYKNHEKIKNINIPVLVMHGEKDQIVPFSMGKKMFDLANDPKSSYFTKHDDHMMEFDNNMVFQLGSFIKSLN